MVVGHALSRILDKAGEAVTSYLSHLLLTIRNFAEPLLRTRLRTWNLWQIDDLDPVRILAQAERERPPAGGPSDDSMYGRCGYSTGCQ